MPEKNYRIITNDEIDGIEVDLGFFAFYGKFKDKEFQSSYQSIYNLSKNETIFTTWENDDPQEELPVIKIISDNQKNIIKDIESKFAHEGINLKLEEL